VSGSAGVGGADGEVVELVLFGVQGERFLMVSPAIP
jgi:hypothetical protein